MGVLYVVGNSLVSEDELQRRAADGTLETLQAEPLARGGGALESLGSGDEDLPKFTPIGLGKPMSIEILTMYSGDVPSKKIPLIGRDPGLLVASAVKGVATYGAEPHAVNQVIPTAEDGQVYLPSALRQGSPIVYYTPSLTRDRLDVSVEIAADTFDEDVLKGISGLFTQAAGLPVFFPVAQYLLGASTVLGIFQGLGRAFLESKQFFRSSLPLHLETPGMPVSAAGHAVLFDPKHKEAFEGYDKADLVPNGPGQWILAPVNEKGEAYAGPAPYVVASIDGRTRTDLESFQPTLATAAMLERFYGSEGRPAAVMESMGKALELYNDLKNRDEAKRIKAKLDKAKPGTPEHAEYQTLYDAYLGNIQNDEFQPKTA